MKPKALVLFSGGIDSTLVLVWAMAKHDHVATLEVNHPGRPRGERLAAQWLARRLGVQEHIHVNLPFGLSVEGAPNGYQATRNLLFHAIGQSLAEARGLDVVLAGHGLEDAQTFRDARPAYFARIETLAGDARPRRRRIPIRLPLLRVREERLLKMLRAHNVPLEHVWSCWRDQTKPCGRCEKCGRRARLEQAMKNQPRATT